MLRLLNFILIAVFLTAIFSSANQCYALEERELYAMSALLMDKLTGRVLYEKNGYQKMAMASTTKIMTCIIALENANLDDTITVSKLATRAPEVKLFLKENEEYRLEDMLYALMLESSNDVAVAIAEGVGGSVEAFCNMMTEKAKSLGAENTSYKTPNGLDAEGHYTTAYDLALITRYALDNEKFMEIINTPSRTFSELNGKRNFTVNNKNAFLNMYEGANGVKTGFTSKAGYCFVGSVKQGDMELISVVLACGWPNNKTYKWHDTTLLMDYGFDNYFYKDFIPEKIAFRVEDIPYAIQDEVEGIADGSVRLICKEDDELDIIYYFNPIEEAPILEGQNIGEVCIYLNGEQYATLEIKASRTVERINYKYCLKKIFDNLMDCVR